MATLNPKDDKYKYYALTPDKELLLWEEWVKIRQNEMKGLGAKIGRPPRDLVMNLLEQTRPKKEWKTALEHAQISKKPKLRDSVWAMGNRLSQRCKCAPVYEAVKTRIELGLPSVIEHVSCPEYIQQHEKGLAGKSKRPECKNIDADFQSYLSKRKEDLKTAIKKVDPIRPEMKELVVIGSKPKTPPPKIPPLPPIIITEDAGPYEDNLSGVYAILVNNTIVCKHISGQTVPHIQHLKSIFPTNQSCYSWKYYFNVPVGRTGRGKFLLKNLGTVALRYCWKKVKKSVPFIPEDRYVQKFFFNKNEDVISPGQQREIYFNFVSDKPGIYSETWEFAILTICMFDVLTEKLIVDLVGDSVENVKKITHKVQKLQRKIDKKAAKRMIQEWLDKVFENATALHVTNYPYKDFLLEAEIFLMKNPVCYYHQSEVQKLKEAYEEMTDGVHWDLSIGTWRDVMIGKEYDDRMYYFDFLKKSHNLVLLKPWTEGDDLLKEKHRMVKLCLAKLADQFYAEKLRTEKYNGIASGISSIEFESGQEEIEILECPIPRTKLTPYIVNNIFYMRMYDHVVVFIETIAGILSSLDLNRWIEFDFCNT